MSRSWVVEVLTGVRVTLGWSKALTVVKVEDGVGNGKSIGNLERSKLGKSKALEALDLNLAVCVRKKVAKTSEGRDGI